MSSESDDARARSNANLKPYKKGTSGNPDGRPSAGLTMKEWLNQMQDWPLTMITATVGQPDAPVCKIAAARAWLHACSMALTDKGTPIAGPDFDRIMDRTLGKPKQSLEVSGPDGDSIPIEYDLRKLDADELRDMREKLQKARTLPPSEN